MTFDVTVAQVMKKVLPDWINYADLLFQCDNHRKLEIHLPSNLAGRGVMLAISGKEKGLVNRATDGRKLMGVPEQDNIQVRE